MAKAAMTKNKPREWIWLQSMTDKDKWSLDHIPDGDAHAPRITRSSKNTDGSYAYFVYRDAKYIDACPTLVEAQKVARTGKMRQDRIDSIARIKKFVDNGNRDAEAFKKLNKHEQQVVADVYPGAMPKRSEMEAKGVKAPRMTRDDLKTKAEKRAEKVTLPLESKIARVRDGNPKKEGTDPWKRWQLMFAYADESKSVEEFIKAGGNPTTLKNAVAQGWVKVKGM